MKLFASDIDGTLSYKGEEIPEEVCLKLKELSCRNYEIFLVTGRTFAFTYPLLKFLNFPYKLAVQNGAALLEMPEKRLIYKKYLDCSIIKALDKLLKHEKTDFLIESGVENNDTCFYRGNRFSEEQLNYLKYREKISCAPWENVVDFDEINIQSFPLIKVFADYKTLLSLQGKIENEVNLHAPIIHDPFYPQHILLLTHPDATKGTLLNRMIKEESLQEIVVAGDDNNDESMIDEGTYKIVMETAPESLKAKADFIAPSAREKGILRALDQLI